MTDAANQSVLDAFDDMGVDLDLKDQRSLSSECLSLGVQFGQSMADLAAAFMKYQHMRMENDFTLKKLHLEPFRKYLQTEIGRGAAAPLSEATNTFYMYTKDDLEDAPDGVSVAAITEQWKPRSGSTPSLAPRPAAFSPVTPSTPPGARLESAWKSPAATYAFSQRPQRNVASVALNANLPRCEPASAQTADVAADRCQLEVVGQPLPPGVRFMYDRLQDKVGAMEDRVHAFAESVKLALGIERFHPVHAASQEKVVVVGRIVCDSEGRLNERSVLLEGCGVYSGGTRVRLELRHVPNFSIFPGQIVAVEGHNPSGHCLVVERVHSSAPAAMTRPNRKEKSNNSSDVKENSDNNSTRCKASSLPLSVVMAAGPFTCSEDVEYEPLRDLLKYAVQQHADLVVLLGPFVDTEHPAVKTGALDVTFEDLFANTVRAAVEAACDERPTLKVVLVPSVRDAHLDMVFPQPTLETHDFEAMPDQVLGVANPSSLMCNEFMIGLSTHDVLKHLSGNEACVSDVKGDDRLARLANHLVSQRSFYPLYPPPIGAALDTSLSHALTMANTPDILLVPSDLSPFAKVLPVNSPAPATAIDTPGNASEQTEDSIMETPQPMDTSCTTKSVQDVGSVLCINPGRLTKGASAGTFVHLHVSAPNAEDVEAQCNQISKRTRVEIVRI